MNNYIGKYKIEYEKDINGNPLENTYIKCRKNGQIYRYNANTLVLYLTSVKRGLSIQKHDENKIIKAEFSDIESLIYFNENDIEYFAELGRAMIQGKDKKPSKKRIKKDKIDDGKKYRYRIVVNGEVYKEDLNPLQASILIKELRAMNIGEIHREKYEV